MVHISFHKQTGFLLYLISSIRSHIYRGPPKNKEINLIFYIYTVHWLFLSQNVYRQSNFLVDTQILLKYEYLHLAGVRNFSYL